MEGINSDKCVDDRNSKILRMKELICGNALIRAGLMVEH
jgi:hypothetical protein